MPHWGYKFTVQGLYAAPVFRLNWIIRKKSPCSANFSCTMAGWLEGVRISRQILFSKGFLEIALIFIAICVFLPTTSYAQVPGFLSIDCGSSHNYTDGIGLEWVTDNGTYIKTGKSFEMPPRKSNLDWYGSTVAFTQPLKTFRYFPEGRNKYCYEVPTTPKSSYLIRANFYLNASVVKDPQTLGQSFLFTVSINATEWFTIASGEVLSQDYYYVVQEGIFYSPGNFISFCLTPVIGVPFINSLELRKLDGSMYSYNGNQRQYLVQKLRYNTGIKPGIPALRWPDDTFDRMWFGPDPGADQIFPFISGPPDNTIYGADVNFVPRKVMQDGWLFNPINNTVQAPFSQNDPRLSIPPGQYAYAIMYTQHLNVSDPRVYALNASLDGFPASELTFSTQPSMLAYPNFILSSSSFIFELTLDDPDVADGPTMNGCEIYAQYNFNFSATNQTDVEAITVFKESFSLNDWHGDPCLPVPHDWLSCSLDSPTFQPISQPCYNSNGTSVLECVVQEGFLRSTYYVKSINLTDLPTSGFGLLAATPNVTLDLLSEVSITNSGVDSRTFQFFVQNISTAANLVSLDFSYNAIDSLPDFSKVQILKSVNLSNNSLADLLDIKLPRSLQSLNLSHNLISSIPPTWQNNSNRLLVLDLSNNQLSDGITSLDQLIQMNNGSLQVLDVSENSLTGTISSSTYFSLPNLTMANFSHNSIQGTLNLSLWYDALKAAVSRETKNVAIGHLSNAQVPVAQVTQLFSFVNNKIVDIVPDASTFEATFTKMDTGQGGVLLGGNPYCNGAKSYTQRYLCRNSASDTIEDYHKESKMALIVGIIGGTVAFVLCCIILATLWRMWKQIYALREIQRALAKRKVQPPFFQYNDLRSGTKDFHKDNKLGHGSFGVVYKAELVDGTPLALKTLFDSRRLQSSLDDFLNEVVLITGIKHRNLVQLKGCCIKDKQRMLVYEYAEKGNLAEALWGSKTHGGLDWEKRFNTCLGVARGLAYLHEELQPSIIHRDIKPANILLDKNCNPKIADFGLARHFSDEGSPMDQTDIAGTLGYLAPEYAQNGHLSEKADVYSYGIVVLEIVSGRKCIDLSLPVEERFLKNWACNLIKDGYLLDVLQPDLRDCCVSAEVIRAINIGLLCVQHRAERRPSMSQVVTMLSGSVDVKGFIGDAGQVKSSFKELLSTICQDIDYPVLRKLAADSTMYPLLSLDSQASISTTEYISKKRLIELRKMHGQ